MNEYELKKLLNSEEEVEKRLKGFIDKEILIKQDYDAQEVNGHFLKSEHNIRFVSAALKTNFFDWAIVGCYYACYHAALALIMTKGYSSKNHVATLVVMIKEFYNKGLDQEDIQVLAGLLDYQDILFYVESKDKREKATYSTKTSFDLKYVEGLRMKTALFVSKIRRMIKVDS